ncbi:trafficking protein particle complex subunit 14 isoform X1 [Hippocampus zosterae]|uniref:trafficking protein particle complex subunit 14 isoform X1 n=1 Tax=Hippocampus zosterae TaxID=109293 RepID=UPI00223D1AB8|nr:trafficking protein particle complex subunit 14 isoform X1 [Hippocampus zosterae]
MESLFEHTVYFPAVGEAADPVDCEALEQRTHFYLGETVHFLVVLRKGRLLKAKPIGDLFAVATVGAQFGDSRRDLNNSVEEETEAEEDQADISYEHHRRSADANRKFIECCPILNHNNARHRMEPVKSTQLSEEQISFRLTVTLDRLPVNTLQATIVVSVWERDEDQVEVREHGYLGLLQLYSPTRAFREDLNKFKAQVSATLNVLPPPSVRCQQLTVSGKHLTFLKVLNGASQEELCITDVRILPNYNLSYLPMMPDGSVLIVDNVCHQSAEVTMASFYRVDSEWSRLPSILGTLEEHNFLFRLQLQDTDDHHSSEGLEIPLVAVLQWRTSTLPHARHIVTFYSLPSIRLNRPRLVMTASCPNVVRPRESFSVKYTLVNNLRDFMSVRLHWNFQGEFSRHVASSRHGRDLASILSSACPANAVRGHQDGEVTAVVCQSPFRNLGRCRKGSSMSFTVVFQILGTGLFELSEHMKMKLQFKAPPEEHQSPKPCTPPSSGSVARSLSFSHQLPPSKPQHVRTGSMMERPFSNFLYMSPEQSVSSLDQVAKRQCQVFVLEHISS